MDNCPCDTNGKHDWIALPDNANFEFYGFPYYCCCCNCGDVAEIPENETASTGETVYVAI